MSDEQPKDLYELSTEPTFTGAELNARLNQLKAMDALNDEENEELELLTDIVNNLDSVWSENTTFINADHFEQHAQEYAAEVEGVREDGAIFSFVDWDGFATNMKMDYAEVEIDVQTFYYRS